MLIKKPVGDRVVIIDTSLLVGVTETGLVLAESTQNVSVKKGKVIAAGPACDEVAVDDIVAYIGSKGIQVRVLDVVYLIMRQGDIECVLDPDELAKLPVAPPQS